MTLHLREMTLEDTPAVAAIEASLNAEPWSEGLFRGEFDVDPAGRHWMVAEIDGVIVGFGGMMYVADDAHLMNIGVTPGQQRQGIARALVGALFRHAVARRATGITLEVRMSNVAARALYAAFGLAPVGTRPGYYTDGEDALILWAHEVQGREFSERLEAAMGASGGTPTEVAT